MELSRDRAGAVARYTSNRGLDQRRIKIEGWGENWPRESNSTRAGRQANRRVEIYLVPVVEGQQQEAYATTFYN